MKVSTTVIKTLLLSLVIAFAGQVRATPDPWFSGIANGNVFETNNVYGAYLDMPGVTVDESRLQIDLDTNTVFKLIPSSQAASENKRTCVVVDNAVFTPTSVDDIDNSVVQNSQTALTVAYDNSSTNYYAYITNAWVKLEGTAPTADPVNVTVVLDYSVSTQTNVTFAVGGSTLWYGDSSNTNFPITTSSRCLERIELAGYGKLHSITSTVEIVATVTIEPQDITFGADFTNVTVTATVSSTADNTDYYLTWGSANVKGNVAGDVVTFNVPIDAPSDAYQSVNYTITAKVGDKQVGTPENFSTKIADVRQWVTEDSANRHTTGSWSNEVAYAETVATVSDNTYTANNCSTGDLVTITFENITYAELGDLSVETPAGTQGAFALAETNISDTVYTNFWVLTKPGEDYVWRRATCSGVEARLNIPYTVVMAFDYASNKYSVSVSDGTNTGDLVFDATSTFDICVDKKAVTDFVFKGNGTLTAIKGEDCTGYMAKDADGNYWVTIQKAVTEGTGPFTILRATDTNAKYSGWKFDNSDGVWKLVRAAVGMFFFAF